MSNLRTSTWWARNWKWCIPAGCLGILGLGLAFVAAVVYVIFGMMKSADVYQEALRLAQSSQAVAQSLGEPVKDGFYVAGNIHVNGPSGSADLSFPISGSKRKGTVYLKATKSMGRWSMEELVVQIESSGERINLLAESAP